MIPKHGNIFAFWWFVLNALEEQLNWFFSCFFWFSNEGLALLYIYKMALITLSLPSSLVRPAFPPLLYRSPAFLLASFPDQPVSSFLPWPLLSPEPSHLHPSSLWALCFCLSYLTCINPQMRAQSKSSSTDPTILGLSPQALAEWGVALTHETDFRNCLLSPGICSWAVFCWSDHCVSIYLQNPCTRSVWNRFILVLHFTTWLVWALSCGLHLQPPFKLGTAQGLSAWGYGSPHF